MDTKLTERFENAAAWAVRLHADHERKGSGIPYVSHLFAVASLVLEDGGSEDEAIAGLLHDAVEDDKTTLAEIEARFGPDVAALVDACSDTLVTPKPPWRERKERYIDHLATASEGALRVSNADKVHNARSLLADYNEQGEDLWTRFNVDAQGAAIQLWYYEGLVEAFLERRPASRLSRELARLVGELRAAATEAGALAEHDVTADPGDADATPARLIRLRYATKCSSCGRSLQPKTSAWWDALAKSARCEPCVAGEPPAAELVVEIETPPPAPAAGGSAQREYEKQKNRYEDAVRRAHPRLGKLILALSDEPQSIRAWAKGAAGERWLGDFLDQHSDRGVVSLHDRRIPRTKANIDHIAVASTGVWVVDAKNYAGRVQSHNVGGWFRPDVRLYVGRRDCTKLAAGMRKQVEAVVNALGDDLADVPVFAALCFVDSDWKLFKKPLHFDDVLVGWPRAISNVLSTEGELDADAIKRVAARLNSALRGR